MSYNFSSKHKLYFAAPLCYAEARLKIVQHQGNITVAAFKSP